MVVNPGEMIGEYVGEVLFDGENKNLEHSFMVPLDDGTNSDETDYACKKWKKKN